MGSVLNEEEYIVKSKSGIFIAHLRKMMKNVEIDMELNKSLNVFMQQLKESQHYLENGIVNLKFAEAGLFLKSAADLYGMRVDSLFDSTLNYRLELASYIPSSEARKVEIEKVTERLNRNKRKRTIIKKVNSNNFTLSQTCDKATEFLNQCLSLNLQDESLLQEANTLSSDSNEADFNLRCTTGFGFHVDSAIKNQQTGEKLCNYSDLYLNCAVPHLEMNTVENTNYQISGYKHDSLLQKFLVSKQISYRDYWKKQLGCELELFNNNSSQRDEACVVLNEINLKNLVDVVSTSNQIGITQDSDAQLDITGTIKRGLERTSNADSLFHEGDLSDACEGYDCHPHPPSQSRADSGIYCSDDPNISFSDGNEDVNKIASCLHEEVTLPELIEDNNITNNISPQIYRTDEKETVDSSIHNHSTIEICKTTNLNPIENHVNINMKRRLSMQEFDEELIKKRKYKPRFKWLKQITRNLYEFERFFKQNYQPENEEGSLSDIETDDQDFLPCLEESGIGTELQISENMNESMVASTDIQINNLITDEAENMNESMVASTDIQINNLNTDEAENISVEADKDNVTQFGQDSINDSTNVQHTSNTISEMETSRVRTVNEWKSFLEVKLQTAEESSKFDIHEYGSFIMESISSESNLPFHVLASGKSAAEVSRLFLASLQLANTCNIELAIPVSSQCVLANDTLEMKLLTKDRYHEHLKQFEAPSESAFRENLARMQALNNLPLHSTPKVNR